MGRAAFIPVYDLSPMPALVMPEVVYAIRVQINGESRSSHPLALVQTDVDDASEEDEVAFRKLEGLELGTKQVAVFGQEVLEQVWIDRATERENGRLRVRKAKANCPSLIWP